MMMSIECSKHVEIINTLEKKCVKLDINPLAPEFSFKFEHTLYIRECKM